MSAPAIDPDDLAPLPPYLTDDEKHRVVAIVDYFEIAEHNRAEALAMVGSAIASPERLRDYLAQLAPTPRPGTL